MDFEKKGKYNGIKLMSFLWEFVMAIIFIVVCIILLLFPSYFQNNPLIKGELRIGLGIVFGLYGLAKVYRAYIKLKERSD